TAATARSRLTQECVAGVISIPLEIRSPESVEVLVAPRGNELNRVVGGHALPLMNFGMPIRKRKAARTCVVRTGNVLPTTCIDVVDEEGIVDRVSLLIYRYPSHRRLKHRPLFEVLTVLLVPPRLAIPIVVSIRSAPAEQGVH